jgi:hypothetical protein
VSTTEQAAKPLPPWAESRAKKILLQDIIDGRIAGKKPTDIFQMHEEYKLYGPLNNFRRRYYSLKAKTGKDLAKANFDSAALAHDRLIHPVGLETSKGCGYPRWQGSYAERLLKQDIDAGLHEKLKPNALRQSRTEYQDFPLAVFRDHIHQESRSRRERSYWLNRKEQMNR